MTTPFFDPTREEDALINTSSFPTENSHPPEADMEETGPKVAWKTKLRNDVESWLETLQTDTEDAPETDQLTEPDLYSFYESLAVLSAESRKSNRRTVEAFNQWNTMLVQFQENMNRWGTQINKVMEHAGGKLSSNHALLIVEICDRMERLAKAFEHAPPKKWWSQDREWNEVWTTQSRAVGILLEHVLEFLKQEGIQRMLTIGQSFDPRYMTAVETETTLDHPHNTVLKEESPGYTRDKETLRVAHVKIAISPEEQR